MVRSAKAPLSLPEDKVDDNLKSVHQYRDAVDVPPLFRFICHARDQFAIACIFMQHHPDNDLTLIIIALYDDDGTPQP